MLNDEEQDSSGIIEKLKADLTELSAKGALNKALTVNTSAITLLVDAIEDLIEENGKKQNFDDKLGETLSSALGKIGEAFVKAAESQKIDIKPLIKSNEELFKSNEVALRGVLSDLKAQHGEMVGLLSTAIANKPTERAAAQDPSIKLLIDQVNKSLQAINNLCSVMGQKSEIKSEIKKLWKHSIVRHDSGRMEHILSEQQ